MEDKEREEQIKKKIIDNIQKFLAQKGRTIQEDKETSVSDKCVQMDVILDTMHFLEDYDRNVEILNKNLQDTRWERE